MGEIVSIISTYQHYDWHFFISLTLWGPMTHNTCVLQWTVASLTCEHIEDETEWPPFSRWHFLGHVRQWKHFNFKYNFTEICSLGFNWQYGSIVSGNELGPNRLQVIIWSNVGMLYIYVSLGLNELSVKPISEQMMAYNQLSLKVQTSVQFISNKKVFYQ